MRLHTSSSCTKRLVTNRKAVLKLPDSAICGDADNLLTSSMQDSESVSPSFLLRNNEEGTPKSEPDMEIRQLSMIVTTFVALVQQRFGNTVCIIKDFKRTDLQLP